jgi:hypothetical protein
VTASLRALLDRLVDYAGLFPPAGQSMDEAVGEYAAHRAGEHGWMLGRFVVPASRLGEFAQAADRVLPRGGDAWSLSVLFGRDLEQDVAAAVAFNAAHRGARCDAAEAKALDGDEIGRIARTVAGSGLTVYVEIPVHEDPAPLIDRIARHRLRAKVRTGGITADAFPAARDVARFLATCVRAGVAFKATAGLHHPLRGAYRLTYEDESPTGTMFGFLNVFLAAALLRDGGSEADAEGLLLESQPAALAFDAHGAEWRGRRFLSPRLSQLRSRVAVSFGSCSFREPVHDLGALGLL